MVWGLDGVQYGLHVIFPKVTVTDDMMPDTLEIFTDRILEEQAVSTYELWRLLTDTARG
jgi:hypothetical protein